MNLKPSHLGLLAIPQNPNQRGASKPERTKLDKLNNRLAEADRFIHPTKGFRKISSKRAKAAQLTAEIQQGYFPLSLDRIKRELKLMR
ncbi:binding-protein-dependent transport systems inner membrane component [Roseibium sp. TrichSKD4]|uniref:hypothetical protein n=1 Tax=Roseibium sp. TrichSKD4 TaxID=744980 RepID=UPI0001E56B60|nr:hypothetical protein [Roseibium sp. TrichSKD4]EFO30140.1 binding-protein-dependent transport systems inner membrane component [Roseibium sp. TrichSKD4]